MKKHILAIVAAVAMTGAAVAQVGEMKVVIADSESMPAEAADYLENRLSAMTSKAAEGAYEAIPSQFFLNAKSVIEEQNVVSGAPTIYTLHIDLSLSVIDWLNNQPCNRTSLTLRGAGQSEATAYMNAFKHLNANNAEWKRFIEESKNKINDYYALQGDRIITSVRTMASQRQYERALFALTVIPTSAGDLYERAQREMTLIYGEYVDYEGQKLLTAARAAWAANQNSDGANAAGALMAQIDPDAACYDAVETLQEEIKSRLGEEWEFEKQIHNDEVSLERDRIDAARRVGVAYGTNQQPDTTTIVP